MKRNVLALTLILVLLLSVLAGKCFASLTEAIQPEIEYKTPPIITIHSPANNSKFAVNNIQLSSTITKPDGWLIHGGYSAQQILKSVNYQLDGEYSDKIQVNSDLESPFEYSVNLMNLTVGVHTLKVYAFASGWVIQMNGFYEYEIPINSSSNIVCFTINTYSPTPTPTLEPTSTPTQTPYEEPQLTEQELILGVAVTAVVIGVGLGLLLYLIKRK